MGAVPSDDEVIAKVACPFCDAKIGEPCHVRDRPEQATLFLHSYRVNEVTGHGNRMRSLRRATGGDARRAPRPGPTEER